MTDHANLLLRLNAGNKPGKYRLTATLDLPGSAVSQIESADTEFDLGELEGLVKAGKREDYGQQLARCLFGPKIRNLLAGARQGTSGEVPLRLRLWIEPDAAVLHRLCWELVHDPDTLDDPEKPADWLATNPTSPLSRFVTSRDRRRVLPRPFDSLKALVVVANPFDLEDYSDEHKVKLPAINVPCEVARAREALGSIPVTLLCGNPELNPDGPPTLEEILTRLGQEAHDILYLVAHGVLDGENPQLWLEGDDREAVVISGVDVKDGFGDTVPGFVTRLSKLPVLPRLAVLASCESASPGKASALQLGAEEAGEPAGRDTWAWAALGPRLAEAGVPAVVAMQGQVTMDTVGKFMPAFFKGLQNDGHIDRAMAAARLAVQDRWDWWMPVLFSRLHDGLLFSSYGWMVGDTSDKFWNTLLDNIRTDKCTPILGPGVTSRFLPTPAEVARSLAARPNYCLPRNNDNLPQVAQFYEVDQPASLKEYVIDILADGFARKMKEMKLEVAPLARDLSGTIEAAGWSKEAQKLFESEIHHQLADFGLSLYVTTNFDNFMALALRSKLKSNKPGQVRQEVLPWRRTVSKEPGHAQWDLPPPKATKNQPVVVHLFGTDRHPELMVLTEDHYLEFLAEAFGDPTALIPSSLGTALAGNSLLFLGYELHDPAFKLILRGLLTERRFPQYRSVAVQLDPSLFDEGRRALVLEYLKDYFVTIDTRLDVYWGNPHQFVDELHRRWQKRGDHG